MKKVVALLLIAIMMLSLCSCGKKVDDGNVNITIGGLPTERTEKDAVWFDNTQKNIAKFEEKYPNIKVTPDSYSFNVKDFLTKAAGGGLPNMLAVAPTELKSIVDNGFARDITKWAKEYGYYDAFDDKYKQIYEVDGKWYGIVNPSSVYYMGIAYNVGLFKEAGLVDAEGLPIYPQTWEELAQTAKTIKDKTGKAGFAIATKNNQGGWHFLNLLWAFGAEAMKEENGKWIATFASEEGVAALQYIKDLKWKYDVLQDELLADISIGGRLLSTNDAAMIITQRSMLDQYAEKFGLDVKNVAMSKMPAGPGGRFSQVSASTYIFSANSTDEQVDACFKWLDMRGIGVNVNEETKKAWEDTYTDSLSKGKIVGVMSSSIWKDENRVNAEKEIMDKYANVDPKFFADYVNGEGVEYRFEPRKCVQQMYTTLDAAIQEVLTDKNADCKKVLEAAQLDFQKNYLDKEQN